MTKPVNIREICLEILQEITEEEAYSHIVLREVLEKYQYLEKRDRSIYFTGRRRNAGAYDSAGLHH